MDLHDIYILQIDFNKDTEAIQWGKVFNKWCQKNWKYAYGENELSFLFYNISKINSKCIISLNAISKSIDFIGENIWKNLCDQ